MSSKTRQHTQQQAKRKKDTKIRTVEEEENDLALSEEEISPQTQEVAEMEAVNSKLDDLTNNVASLTARMDKLQGLENLPAQLAQLQTLVSLPGEMAKLNQTTLEVLQKLKGCEKKVTQMEKIITAVEGKVLHQEADLKESREEVVDLNEKVMTLEGALRRRNLRLVGLPVIPAKTSEELTIHIEDMLREVLDLPTEFNFGLVDVVRLRRPNRATAARLTILIEFSRISVRDLILRTFRERSKAGNLKWQGNLVSWALYPDYPLTVLAKRREYKAAKELAQELQLEFYIRFPADFTVIVQGEHKVFHSPPTALAFLKQLK